MTTAFRSKFANICNVAHPYMSSNNNNFSHNILFFVVIVISVCGKELSVLYGKICRCVKFGNSHRTCIIVLEAKESGVISK